MYENTYTKLILDECNFTQTDLNLVHNVKEETAEFSNALDVVQKCKLKMEWKHNSTAKQLTIIFDQKNTNNISSMVMSLTSTYVPSFLIM